MAAAADTLPPIDEGQRRTGPRYEYRTTRQVIHRPTTVPYGNMGSSGTDQRHPSSAGSPSLFSRPPAYNPRVARRGLFAKEWVGDHSAVLNTIAGRAKSLEQRVQLVSQYTEAGDLKPVDGLDNLTGMPYTAYGFQGLNQQQMSPYNARQPQIQDSFLASRQLYSTAFSTAKLQPSRPASMLSSIRSTYEREPFSQQQQELLMSSMPLMSESGKSRTQLFRPVYSTWSTQPGRPYTSLEVYSDFWARSSTPLSSTAPSPASGDIKKIRRRLPAAPPGRVSVSPNFTAPGEPAYVSQLVESGVSRLDGPLRETVSKIDDAFMRIHELIRSHEASEVENAAATTIQKIFRGWVARIRYAQAIWAVRAWYREELAIPRQRMLDWTQRREKQEEYISIVRQCQNKDLLRATFRAWTFNLDTNRKMLKAKDERAAVFFNQLLLMRVRELMKKWLAVSLGDRSRKASLARRKMRSQAARARLVGMAEEMGWTGNITEDMIKRELENEAVGLMTNKIRLRMYRSIMGAWSKFSQFRRIAKGKHLESDRKHSQFLINKAWRSWRGAVTAKMEKWQSEGRDFNRRKLWGIARREGRTAIQRWALRYWIRRVRITGRLSVHAKMMMSRTQAAYFQAFREQVQIQRELRAMAMEQWRLVSRDVIGYPFRCWIKFTSHQKTLKQERMKTAGAMLYRYRRRLIIRCFSALKINVEQSRLHIDLPRLQPEPQQPESKSLGASSRNLKINNSTEKLDAELDELMRGGRDRKNESMRRSRRESFSSSNRRGVLFQLDSSKNSSFSGHHAESAAREDTERFIGSLEKNLDLVLSAPMLDPSMEAHRLRVFLENLGNTISESRNPALEAEDSGGTRGIVSPDVHLGAPSPKTKRFAANSKSSRSMRGLLATGGDDGDATTGRKSPRSRPTSRASSKPKTGKNKSFKQSKMPSRNLSKHQLAFFSARDSAEESV